MGSPICFVDKCKFIGLSLSHDIFNRDIHTSICLIENVMKLDSIFPFLKVILNQNLFLYFLWIYGTLVQIIIIIQKKRHIKYE